MSRIGKNPIALPAKTEANLSSERVLTVKGPLGVLTRTFRPEVNIEVGTGEIVLTPTKENNISINALWGTYASHVRNMVDGVNKPFEKKLIVEGVGYKWAVNGNVLTLNIGFSHPVDLAIPEGLTVEAVKNNLTVTGINKEEVGAFAAKIRTQKKPEPYKGKGIRYSDEVVRRKQGKKNT